MNLHPRIVARRQIVLGSRRKSHARGISVECELPGVGFIRQPISNGNQRKEEEESDFHGVWAGLRVFRSLTGGRVPAKGVCGWRRRTVADAAPRMNPTPHAPRHIPMGARSRKRGAARAGSLHAEVRMGHGLTRRGKASSGIAPASFVRWPCSASRQPVFRKTMLHSSQKSPPD